MIHMSGFKKIFINAPIGVLVITSLPVFDAVGIVTATSMAGGTVLGALDALFNEINDASN